MSKYCCHCTVNSYDEGFKEDTTARPTIVVDADTENEAIGEAKSKLHKRYSGPKNIVRSVIIEVIRKID